MHQYSGIDVYLSSRVEERLNNFTEQELLDKTTFIICFSERKMDEHSLVPVSYTHLTLPTIYSV